MVHIYNDNDNDNDNDNTTHNNNNINNESTFGLTQYLGDHSVGHVHSTEIWYEYLDSAQPKSLKNTDIQRKWKTHSEQCLWISNTFTNSKSIGKGVKC